MKTPDEIKKALECCFYDSEQCGECPYYPVSCDRELVRDAREYIRQLETSLSASQLVHIVDLNDDAVKYIQHLQADNAQLNRCIENMTDKLNAMNDETAELQVERDAAVKDMTKIVQELGEPYCEYCGADFKPNCTGRCWTHNEGFVWRGVHKEG